MKVYWRLFKAFYVVGILALLSEVLYRYHNYIKYEGHLQIMRTMTFYVLVIFAAAVVLTALSAFLALLKRHTRFAGRPFNGIHELAMLSFLGFVVVESVLIWYPEGLTYSYVVKVWVFSALAAFIAFLIISFGLNEKERLVSFFHHKVVGAFWPPFAIFAVLMVIFSVGAYISEESGREPVVSGSDLAAYRATEQKRPNVFFITFDGLTVNDMSLYGYYRNTTPNIEKFAKESFVFNRAYSNYANTGPAMATIITSKYPLKHGLYASGASIANRREENLSTVLREYGYYTISVAGVWEAHPLFLGLMDQFDNARGHLIRLAPGIETLDIIVRKWFGNQIPVFELPVLSKFLVDTNKLKFGAPDALTTLNIAAFVIDQVPDRPLFTWIHLQPPREPYFSRKPFRDTFFKGKGPFTMELPMDNYEPRMQPVIDNLRARYDEKLLQADNDLQEFFRWLKKRGLYQDSIIIISSDHGESFEKGFRGHASEDLIDAELHIPLIIRLPGQKEGKRIDAMVEQRDFAPTILDLLEMPVPGWMDGQTLLPFIEGEKLEREGPIFAMQLLPVEKGVPARLGTFAVMEGDYKFIWNMDAGKEELYNLALDKGELKNLFTEEPEKAASLKELITDTISSRHK